MDEHIRYARLIEGYNTSTRVEPLRRLRALGDLLDACSVGLSEGALVRWLAERGRDEALRAAAGLRLLGHEAPAARLAALVPVPRAGSMADALWATGTAGVVALLAVERGLAAQAEGWQREVRLWLVEHHGLSADRPSPEVLDAPVGWRRWRAPAVTAGGVFGAERLLQVLAAYGRREVGELRARVEAHLVNELLPDPGLQLAVDWGEPLQVRCGRPARADREAPVGALGQETVLRPWPGGTERLVHALAELLRPWPHLSLEVEALGGTPLPCAATYEATGAREATATREAPRSVTALAAESTAARCVATDGTPWVGARTRSDEAAVQVRLRDARAPALQARLWALEGRATRPGSAPAWTQRVFGITQLHRQGGLVGWLAAEADAGGRGVGSVSAAVAETMQALEAVGLPELAHRLARLLEALPATALEDLGPWLATCAPAQRVRFALIERAVAECGRAASLRLFDWLEAHGWGGSRVRARSGDGVKPTARLRALAATEP